MIRESEILTRFAKSEATAFEHIYEHYFDVVFYYILNLVQNKVEAEDLAEDVFIKLWEKRKTISVRKSLKNYILSIAHNTVIDFFSSKKISKDKLSLNSELPYATETQELIFNEFSDTYLIVKDLRKEIHSSINNLPNKCRKIFKMSRLYDMKNAEIADKLDISINTVEKQISIALRKLRVALVEYIPFYFFLIKLLSK